jgi:hypothetical protein
LTFAFSEAGSAPVALMSGRVEFFVLLENRPSQKIRKAVEKGKWRGTGKNEE